MAKGQKLHYKEQLETNSMLNLLPQIQETISLKTTEIFRGSIYHVNQECSPIPIAVNPSKSIQDSVKD